jgi:hypothetical protein
MFQSLVWDQVFPWDMLVWNVPDKKKKDLDYIISLIDWDLNTDPDFVKNRFLEPKPVKPLDEMKKQGYEEYFIQYKSEYFGAKELTVYPGNSMTIREDAAYGLIVVQGQGSFGDLAIESPVLIRFGQMTNDELFVTAKTAQEGVTVVNTSDRDNLVILKHFGPR